MSVETQQARGSSQPPDSRSPLISLVAIMIFFPAAVILTGLVWFWPARDPITPLGCFVLSLIIFGVHLALCGRRLGAFDPGLWIPVLMLLHYFGMVVPVELMPNSGYFTYDTYGWGLPQVARGFAMALDALLLFVLGFHLVPTSDMNRAPDSSIPAENAVTTAAMILMLGGVAMMAIGIPVAGASLLFGSYGEMTEAVKFGLSDYRLVGGGFLFAAGGTYAVFATLDRIGSLRFRIAVFCAAFILVLLVLLGDRTGMSLVIFAGGWALTQRLIKIPRWLTIGGFCFMFLLMPMIKEYREYRDVEVSETRTVSQLAAATLYEMGSSVQVYSFTIDRIPSEKDFSWGKSFLVQTITNLPNVTGSAGTKYLIFDPLVYYPSKWVTWTASPSKYYNAGGGFGYAVGAEWYFNFGFPGLFFGMIWMGWVTAFLRDRSRQSPMWLIFGCRYYGVLVTAVRNAIGYPMRTMLWPLAGFWILIFVLRHLFPSSTISIASGENSGEDVSSPDVVLDGSDVPSRPFAGR